MRSISVVKAYKKKLLIASILRGANLTSGIVVSSVVLSLPQKRDQIFYESPWLALSLLLGVVYLFHCIYSLIMSVFYML